MFNRVGLLESVAKPTHFDRDKQFGGLRTQCNAFGHRRRRWKRQCSKDMALNMKLTPFLRLRLGHSDAHTPGTFANGFAIFCRKHPFRSRAA